VGGAWLATQLWDHYLFAGDEQYLRDVYSIMKGSVEFLLDILVEHPEYGWLVTAPSNSPENFPAWEGNGRFFDEVSALFLKARTITAGPTMDMQIIRALFDAYAEAAERRPHHGHADHPSPVRRIRRGRRVAGRRRGSP
jgi:alpha-L-fucosidase 2